MSRQYNAPPGTPSDAGPQIRTDYYWKKALIEVVKEQYFGQLADTVSMPKNMGKTIKRYHYLPMLDDRNINDQGIDAAGVTIDSSKFTVRINALTQQYAVQGDADAAVAAAVAIEAGTAVRSGAGPYTVTYTKLALGPTTDALSATAVTDIKGAIRVQGSGNLYGSSKDVGTISGKLPALSETGGRVNRVGFKRIELEGTIEKFGFFDEYTQESLDFDTDAELMTHVNREMLRGANEITEDALQVDLLNSAGVIKYAGDATIDAELGTDDVVSYGDLMRLSIDLDNNRTPKSTKVITGSRMIDTKVIPAARVCYIGTELLPTFKAMKDLHDQKAFIEVQHYASAGTVIRGEAGTLDHFRIVVVPEMMKWAGAGAEVTDSINYDDGSRYDVFPILVVGDESFTTIGFQTDGKTVKFKILHKKPGMATADRNDPYGETGFMSIKWYYGFMALRSERLALLKTVARL